MKATPISKTSHSSIFLVNKSKSSSMISCPKCSDSRNSNPALMWEENTLASFGLACFFSSWRHSILSMLKHPFRLTAASISCGEGKYCGTLKESSFSSLMIPCSSAFKREKEKHKGKEKNWLIQTASYRSLIVLLVQSESKRNFRD